MNWQRIDHRLLRTFNKNLINDNRVIKKDRQVITGGQIRAARAFLRWTIKDVASASGVSVPTVHRFEQVDGVPPSRSQSLLDLKRAFEEAGVEFIGTPEDDPGVRLKSGKQS
jgi:DNA-binding transcriptional regulator YiaG